MGWVVFAGIALVAGGCATAGTREVFQYELYGGGTNGGRSESCTVEGHLVMPRIEFRRWEGALRLEFRRARRRNRTDIIGDSVIPAQSVRLERGQSEQEWTLLMLSPLVDTILLTYTGRDLSTMGRRFTGEWVCGSRLPFADDSTVAPIATIDLYTLHR
jgi:hypothetical protein